MAESAEPISPLAEQIEWMEVAGNALAGTQWPRPLAARIGVSPRTVSYWRDGSVRMTAERWYLIADALDRACDEARALAQIVDQVAETSKRPGLALFEQIGETLYGPRWQGAIAEDIGVSRRWVVYCTSGERPVQRGHFLILAERLRERADEREAIARIIRTYTGR